MAAKCLLGNYSCVINCYIWTTVMFWFSFFPPFHNSKKESKQTGTRSVGRRCGRRCSLGECSRFPTSTDILLIWREPVLLLWCGTLCREGDTCRRVPFDPAGKGRKLECWEKILGCGSDGGGSAQREADPCLFLRRECWNYYLLVMRSTLGAGGIHL